MKCFKYGKILLMKFFVIAVLFLSSSAYAARHTVPQVFEGEYVGREIYIGILCVLSSEVLLRQMKS
jgi:hypothetical protein